MRQNSASIQNEGKAIYSLSYDITAPLKVAAVGLLKAGKSTFLSAITQQPDHFKSGVIRTTIQNQVYTDRFFSWIDTPGIDDTAQETATALAGVDGSDVVLFVHNLKQGELDQSEVAFMKQCAAKNKQFFEKLVFVLTHFSDVGDQSAAEIIQVIKKQCKEHLSPSVDFEFFTVSSLSYIKGLKEKKKILMQRSGVPTLQQSLLRSYRFRLMRSMDLQIELINQQLIKDRTSIESSLKLTR